MIKRWALRQLISKACYGFKHTGVVDYCGYGPFAHTDTKPNNKPLLGFEGYRELQKHPIEIPVIAVGGIQLDRC